MLKETYCLLQEPYCMPKETYCTLRETYCTLKETYCTDHEMGAARRGLHRGPGLPGAGRGPRGRPHGELGRLPRGPGRGQRS